MVLKLKLSQLKRYLNKLKKMLPGIIIYGFLVKKMLSHKLSITYYFFGFPGEKLFISSPKTYQF